MIGAVSGKRWTFRASNRPPVTSGKSRLKGEDCVSRWLGLALRKKERGKMKGIDC